MSEEKTTPDEVLQYLDHAKDIYVRQFPPKKYGESSQCEAVYMAMEQSEEIITSLKTLLEQSQQEVERLRGIIQELVDLKELKDSEGKTGDYLLRQPAAWINAKEALKK